MLCDTIRRKDFGTTAANSKTWRRRLKSEDGKLLQAHINGEDVKAKNSYRVATIDFVAQGNDDMTAFKASTDVVMPKEEKNNVRNVIAEYFKEKMKNGETVDAKVEGRIVIEK